MICCDSNHQILESLFPTDTTTLEVNNNNFITNIPLRPLPLFVSHPQPQSSLLSPQSSLLNLKVPLPRAENKVHSFQLIREKVCVITPYT